MLISDQKAPSRKQIFSTRALLLATLSAVTFGCKSQETLKSLDTAPAISSTMPVTLPWTNTTIDVDKVIRASKLNPSDLIDHLRNDYNIKVIITNQVPAAKLTGVVDLSFKKLAQDSQAEQYYSQDLNNEIPNDAIAFTFPPHWHASRTDKIGVRPYHDKHLIVLSRFMRTDDILHEFCHFLINQQLPPVQFEGQALDPSTVKAIQIERALSNPKSLNDAAQAEKLILDITSTLSYTVGEELDICRFLVENSARLNIPSSHLPRHLEYYSQGLMIMRDKDDHLSLLARWAPSKGQAIQNLQIFKNNLNKSVAWHKNEIENLKK